MRSTQNFIKKTDVMPRHATMEVDPEYYEGHPGLGVGPAGRPRTLNVKRSYSWFCSDQGRVLQNAIWGI